MLTVFKTEVLRPMLALNGTNFSWPKSSYIKSITVRLGQRWPRNGGPVGVMFWNIDYYVFIITNTGNGSLWVSRCLGVIL